MGRLNCEQKKRYCVGCRDNFYNGFNDLGISECWNLKSAKLVEKKFIPLDMTPPWDVPVQKTLSCYRKKGYVKVDKYTMHG